MPLLQLTQYLIDLSPQAAYLTTFAVELTWIAMQCLGVLLLADFVSGAVHWAEDTYWDEKTPVIGKWVIEPNILHHDKPGHFLKHSWWGRSRELMLVSLSLIGITWLLGALSWQILLFALIATNANQVHAWAHMSRKRVPRAVAFLQWAGLFQSQKEHGAHHRGDHDGHYCAATNYLNPILDRGFWRGVEWALRPFMGPARKRDEVRKVQKKKLVKRPAIERIETRHPYQIHFPQRAAA